MWGGIWWAWVVGRGRLAINPYRAIAVKNYSMTDYSSITTLLIPSCCLSGKKNQVEKGKRGRLRIRERVVPFFPIQMPLSSHPSHFHPSSPRSRSTPHK